MNRNFSTRLIFPGTCFNNISILIVELIQFKVDLITATDLSTTAYSSVHLHIPTLLLRYGISLTIDSICHFSIAPSIFTLYFLLVVKKNDFCRMISHTIHSV